MKKIFLITLLAVALNKLSISQFKEGYIINNSNDTIYGYINWEGSIKNSKQCEFKLKSDGETKVYKPGEITAFRFSDSKYFSTWDLTIDNQTNIVFIEWLIKGRSSLLAYSESVTDIKYFLLTEDGTLTELANTTHEFVRDGVTYKRKKQEYINTLLFNFRDCPPLETKIKTIPFKSKSLISITKKYHELTCKTEDCVVFEEKNRDMIFDWGIYTSFLNSNWVLNNEIPEKVYPVNSFGYGVAINIRNLPALPPEFAAKINIAIFSSIYRYDTTDVVWSYINDDRILKITYAKIPVQLTYRFTQTKFSPYLSVGGTVNLRFLYKQYDQYLTDYITRSRPSSHYTSKVSPVQFGYNTGLGFEFLASPSLRFNIGYDFEFCPRLYGTYADDHSRVFNNAVYLRAYFYGRKK